MPGKNIINFCGKPLLAWTIEHCLEGGAAPVYVSSDSDEILTIAENYGAFKIQRPKRISGDTSDSESGWLHALEVIEDESSKFDWIMAPQVTSPLRTSDDIRKGLEIAKGDNYDSIFSCCVSGTYFFWTENEGKIESINYDWRNRYPRQDTTKMYIENGSFYMFRPDILRQYKNRLGGRIGMVEMEFWKMFEIDNQEELRICSTLMKEFLVEKR